MIALAGNHDRNHSDGESRAPANGYVTKREANLTAASVRTAMAQPGFAKSARNEETSHLVAKRATPPRNHRFSWLLIHGLAGEVVGVLGQ
jgi:hypothetical protein